MVDTTGSPGEPETPTRAHSRGGAREYILATATALIAERGVQGVTLEDVADACSVAPSSLAYQYPTMADLLTAVLARRDEVAEREHRSHDAPGRELLMELLRLAENNARSRHVVELFTVTAAEGTQVEHPAHDYFQVRFIAVQEQFTRALVELEGAGELRDGVDPASAARQTVALMDGLQLQWLYDDSVDMAADLRRFFNSLLVSPVDE